MRKSLLWLLVGLVFLVGAGELIARTALGLGTPPLSVSHPKIEYMFAPNQDVRRFGNRQRFNEFGMRSVPMLEVTQERIVLALGDSVLNGGNLTDHQDLATTLSTDSQTFFGNVSAGSWGPQNIKAWLDEFGFLGADSIVLVLSSHDLTDFPKFEPLNPNTHPTRNPPLALLEGINRYLPRLLRSFQSVSPSNDASHPDRVLAERDIERGRADLHQLLDMAREAYVRVCVVLHPTQSEIHSGPMEQRVHMTSVFDGRGVPVIDGMTTMSAALRSASSPYRDDIHINEAGQRILADKLKECAEAAVVPEVWPAEIVRP